MPFPSPEDLLNPGIEPGSPALQADALTSEPPGKPFPHILQFSSVAPSCPTLGDPMNRSTPGLPVHYQIPEFTHTHVHGVGDAILAISSSVDPFSTCPHSLPASGSCPVSQFFASGGQSLRVSASTSVLPMNIQD